MAFFRTVSFSETAPAIEGDGVVLRAPQMADYERMGGAARGEPRLPHAVGADLAGRRSDRAALPPPAAPLRRGPAHRPVLCVLPVPQEDDALVGGLTLANIRRGVAQAGSLGYWMGAAVRAAAAYMTRGGARAGAVRVRVAAAAPARGRLHSRPTRPRSACSSTPASRARAMRANTSASTGSGRTTCCSRGSRTIRLRVDDPVRRA